MVQAAYNAWKSQMSRSEVRSNDSGLPEGLSKEDKIIADKWTKGFVQKLIEMSIQASQAGYAYQGISQFYDQLNYTNPIFDPGNFAREFRLAYPDPEKSKPVFNYVIDELGQSRYVSIFWDAYINKKYAWYFRNTNMLETKLQRLDYLSSFPQIRTPEIHMELVEHENTELGFIPENEIGELKSGANLINRWIREGHVIDRFRGDFVRHVRQIHALAARSLRGTSVDENGVSYFRMETVETNLRPLIYPWPMHVEALLNELDERVRSKAFKEQNAVLKAAEVYMRVRDTHPFPDGNERTAKLLMNYYLMRNHLPPLQLTPENREEFIAVTRFMKRPEEFADFLADQLKKQTGFYKSQGDLLPYLVSPEDTLKNHLVVFPSGEEIYHAVADEIQALIQHHRKSPEEPVMLIAWGGTMRQFFKGEFMRRASLDKTDPQYLDLSKLKIIFGTEIVKSRAQYLEFLREVVRKLPRHNRLKIRQIIHYDDSKLSPEEAVGRFSAQMGQIPAIHLAAMGIGVKGNLGFNARNSSYDSTARIVKLFQSTRSRHKIENEYAFTAGIKEILKAHKILILGLSPLQRGVSKKRAIELSVKTLDVPASAVRFHPAGNFSFYIDKA
ncbi:MAG TPA: Fic family protein, partial [bacterium]|nr:Fic family protein [bacterium]